MQTFIGLDFHQLPNSALFCYVFWQIGNTNSDNFRIVHENLEKFMQFLYAFAYYIVQN